VHKEEIFVACPLGFEDVCRSGDFFLQEKFIEQAKFL
jgi:hypothetical protein